MNPSRLWIFFSAEFERIEQLVKMNCTQKTLCFQHLEHLEQLVQINNVKIKRCKNLLEAAKIIEKGMK